MAIDISQLIASAKSKVGKVAQKFDRDQSMPGFQLAQGGLGNRLAQPFQSRQTEQGYKPSLQLRAAAGLQNFAENKLANLGRFNLMQPVERIQNPIARTIVGLPVGVAQGFLNAPLDVTAGAATLGREIGKGFDPTRTGSFQQGLAGGARIGEGLLNAYTGGKAPSAIEGLGKQTLLNSIKAGARAGAGYGAVGGALVGLQDTSGGLGNQLGQGLKQAVLGAPVGAVAGGVLGGVGYGLERQKIKTTANRKAMEKAKNDFFSKEIPQFLKQPDPVKLEMAANTYYDTHDTNLFKLKGRLTARDASVIAAANTPDGLSSPTIVNDLTNIFKSRLDKAKDTNLSPQTMAKELKYHADKSGIKPGFAKLDLGLGKETSNPKGIRTSQEMVSDLSSTTGLNKPLEGEISTRTMANQEVSSQPIISNKGKLNLERLAVDEKGKQALQDINQGIPTSVISNKSVIEKAKMAKGNNKPMSDKQMQNLLAQQLKNRQQVVDLSAKFSKAKSEGASEVELSKIMLELANQSRTAQQGGTFAGRLLQAQNIVADQSATPMQKILALLDNAGVSQDKYLKDSIKVNWENPTEVVKFYRKYVPPKLGEVLTEIRYTNMLSSPLTHITNIASNALQTGLVTPVEKTVTGLLDAVRSQITGKEREYYASAGINYTKGYLKSLPEALQKARNIMNQTETTIRPDMEYMPTGVGGPLQAYTTPLRALEAMDQLFKTLVQGGVTKELQAGPKKMSQTQIGSQASKEADYRLFRQAFDPNGELGQGPVLQLFDKWNSAINGLRRLPGGKWVLPFLQTPTNILKQGVEYSPLGVITAPGSKAPLEQLSKTLIGTAVYATAYQLASSGLTSWEAPNGEKERALYYAAGMQPYSVKIGDKWVSFSKLGPLSYPIAMAAALAEAERKNPDKTKTENIAKSVSGMLGFFGDQSYVRSIGDLVDAIQGGVNVGPSAISGQAANLAGQLIPYKSFQTWLGRIIDPTYRKAQTFTEKMIKDLPILGSQLEPYRDLQGRESKRDLPLLNAVSPLRVTQEKSGAVPMYERYQEAKTQRKRIDDAKKKIEAGQEVDSIGGVYLNMDGSTVDVGKVASMPSTSGFDKVKKQEATYKILDDVLKLPIDQQEEALKKLNITPYQAQYYQVSNSSVEAKTAFVQDQIESMINQGSTRNDVIGQLIKLREDVNGTQIASDNVLKKLVDQNIISQSDYNNLKQVKLENGQIKRKVTGRAKKVKAPQYNFKALMKPTKVARRGKVKIKRIKI